MSDRVTAWFGIHERATPLFRAGVLLGLGLGGFFDGIVFHQILQWHHLLSSHSDPAIAGDLRVNVLADGLFHAATYLFTVAGIAMLWRANRRATVPESGRTLLGSILFGWGVFNLVEGVVNHQLLGIHHVWPDGPGSVLLWDVAFLLWGALFVLGGYWIVRSTTPPATLGAAESGNERTE